MKNTLLLLFILTITCAKSQEVSLFDSKGAAIAYIADDSDQTIYLWEGEPVAYFSDNDIYGFNGKHLGWWQKGIIYNQEGDVVAAIKQVINGYTEYESFKGFKQFKPFKSFKEFAPFQPYLSSNWSNSSLRRFLLQGVD